VVAACAALGLAFAVPIARAEAPAPPVLDSHLRAEIVDSLAAQVMRHYVEADTARMVADGVRARLRSGAYDRFTRPVDFSEAVTTDLRRVNGDLHLSLRYDPEAGTGGGPTIVTRTSSGPPGAGEPIGGRRIVVEGPPGAGSTPGEPTLVRRTAVGGPEGAGGVPDSAALARSPFARVARETNYGLGRLEILPGNIGYLEITGFNDAPGMEPVLVSALKFLERTDAVIIDVRRNRGGSGNMSDLLLSHFLGDRPVETLRVKSREPGLSRLQQSLAEVPGPRRPDVPLYVLTSRGSGSASEAFSFVLKNLGRATLVGDRTAGAGHMVSQYALPAGFVAGVSITRVSDPRTGLEWEGVGVQPDVKVAPERALAVAHAAALRVLAAKAADDRARSRYGMLAEFVEARDRGARPDPKRGAGIAGAYEGDRTVAFENGRLLYRRGGGMPEELVPLSGERYALGGESVLTFDPGSTAASMMVARADGSTSSYPRVRAAD
jgi:hypothetical protein